MATIQELQQVLATSALSEEEKQAWENAAPHLSDEQRAELIDLLKDEREKIDQLREEYVEKLETLLDEVEK